MISPTAPGETDQYEGLSTDQSPNWAPERDINEGRTAVGGSRAPTVGCYGVEEVKAADFF